MTSDKIGEPKVGGGVRFTVRATFPPNPTSLGVLYTDAQHKNPLCRVVSIGSENESNGEEKNVAFNYDKEKYKEMIGSPLSVPSKKGCCNPHR